MRAEPIPVDAVADFERLAAKARRDGIEFGAATPVLRVSKLWAEAAVTIGFLLIVLRTIQMMRRDIGDLRGGRAAYQGKALFED